MSDAGDPHPVIVFDGVCVLCSHWVRFLLKHDRAERYRFAAMQTPTGQALLREHGLDPRAPQSLLLLDGSASYTDTAAIMRVLDSLGARRWRWLARAIPLLPRALRDPLYRFIARHRYRIFGRSDACFVPTPAQRQRFIG